MKFSKTGFLEIVNTVLEKITEDLAFGQGGTSEKGRGIFALIKGKLVPIMNSFMSHIELEKQYNNKLRAIRFYVSLFPDKVLNFIMDNESKKMLSQAVKKNSQLVIDAFNVIATKAKAKEITNADIPKIIAEAPDYSFAGT